MEQTKPICYSTQIPNFSLHANIRFIPTTPFLSCKIIWNLRCENRFRREFHLCALISLTRLHLSLTILSMQHIYDGHMKPLQRLIPCIIAVTLSPSIRLSSFPPTPFSLFNISCLIGLQRYLLYYISFSPPQYDTGITHYIHFLFIHHNKITHVKRNICAFCIHLETRRTGRERLTRWKSNGIMHLEREWRRRNHEKCDAFLIPTKSILATAEYNEVVWSFKRRWTI